MKPLRGSQHAGGSAQSYLASYVEPLSAATFSAENALNHRITNLQAFPWRWQAPGGMFYRGPCTPPFLFGYRWELVLEAPISFSFAFSAGVV